MLCLKVCSLNCQYHMASFGSIQAYWFYTKCITGINKVLVGLKTRVPWIFLLSTRWWLYVRKTDALSKTGLVWITSCNCQCYVIPSGIIRAYFYYSHCDTDINKVSISFRMTSPWFFIKNSITLAFCKKKWFFVKTKFVWISSFNCQYHIIPSGIMFHCDIFHYKVSLGFKMA